jgi:hypothetical protein
MNNPVGNHRPHDEHGPPPPKERKLVLAKFTGTVEGLDCSIAVEIDPRKLRDTALFLQRHGFHAAPREFARDAEGQPICPRHGVPMRERQKQGDTWFSHRATDDEGVELWCRGRPGPDSPGWRVDRNET